MMVIINKKIKTIFVKVLSISLIKINKNKLIIQIKKLIKKIKWTIQNYYIYDLIFKFNYYFDMILQ